MKRVRIQLLVTDLDNTLYDWVSSFVPAFYGMVDVAAQILRVDREELLDDLKAVHQRYHNSEQPFALLETHIVERRYPRATRLERKRLLAPAFDAFNELRRQNLRLYPEVRETLHTIRDRGCGVIGYTEAVVENSLYRLCLLGLLEEIQLLYVPKSRADEGHPDPARQRILEQHREKVRLLPDGHRKPDPHVLKQICEDRGVPVEEALYVGDSMTRDVAMAKAAGVHAAWARYGSALNPNDWNKLVRVTHWTAEDVAREMRLKEEYRDVRPDVEIDSFAELLAPDERRARQVFDYGSKNESLITASEPVLRGTLPSSHLP
ncbi:MAG: HAD family hydrolase [Acidobacteriota bacterium]